MTDALAGIPRPDLCRLPILVGVTGHRDLSDWGRPRVKEAVRAVLTALKADYGASTPIAVVSSLAKGADQIVAEVGIELGLRVCAVLPVEPERLEVGDPDAHRVALRILDHPLTETIVLPAFPDLEKSLAATSSGNPQWLDELHYEQAGLVIARHSHVMLALVHPNYVEALAPLANFRPDEQAPIGGSRRIMEFWVTGRLPGGVVGVSPLAPLGELLRPVLTGPLVHVASPRDQKRQTPETSGFEAGKLSALLPARRLPAEPGEASEEYASLDHYLAAYFGRGTHTFRLLTGPEYQNSRWREAVARRLKMAKARLGIGWQRAVLPHLTEFNRRIEILTRQSKRGHATANAIAQSLNDLVRTDAMQQLVAGWPPEKDKCLSALIDKQRHLFAGADGLANTYHERLKRLDVAILAAVPAAVLAFEMFIEVTGVYQWLIVYVAVFAAALGVYGYARVTNLQDWYQDFRLIGEAARVQFFWSLAGIPRSVADEHQSDELGEGSWLYAAIKAVALASLRLAERSSERDFVLREWLGGPLPIPRSERNPFCYRDWYHRAAQLYRDRYRRHGRRQAGLFLLGILSAAVLIVLLATARGTGPAAKHMPDWIETALKLLIPTLPALGAVFGLWRERRAYEVHAHEYRRMEEIVLEGLSLLEARFHNDPTRQAEIMYEIGREGLHEGARWLLAHRRQPIRPVVGS
jgi:hypothetical protein